MLVESGSWALGKESRIPRTSGIRNPNSSDKDPESPLHFPRRGIVLDSLTCLSEAMRSRLLCEEIRPGYITISVRYLIRSTVDTFRKDDKRC